MCAWQTTYYAQGLVPVRTSPLREFFAITGGTDGGSREWIYVLFAVGFNTGTAADQAKMKTTIGIIFIISNYEKLHKLKKWREPWALRKNQ